MQFFDKFVKNYVMKKIFIACIILILVFSLYGIISNCQDIIGEKKLSSADYLRIHIRANSNEEFDQNIKYKIKEKYVEFLTPKIAFCASKQNVVDMVNEEKINLQNLADDVLKQYGFEYQSKVSIKSEMFPTRTYEDYTLESGVYDALIVELGEAKGNNWWCVIYPPLCFTNYSSTNSTSVVYKSKILEIIKKFFS